MNSTIIAAIITGSCAIVAAIIGVSVKNYNKKKRRGKDGKGITIGNNKMTEVVNSKIQGDVDIIGNEELKMRGAEINGNS